MDLREGIPGSRSSRQGASAPLEQRNEISPWESAWHSVLRVAQRREATCLGVEGLVPEPEGSQGCSSLCHPNFSTLSHIYPTQSHHKHTFLPTAQRGHMAVYIHMRYANVPLPLTAGQFLPHREPFAPTHSLATKARSQAAKTEACCLRVNWLMVSL